MSNEAQNATQSAEPAGDNATATADVTPLAAELGPNGLPVHPPEGEAPAKVDHNLIMDTFFGEGELEPNPTGGQAKGPNPAGGQTEGSLAPPAAAPAANGEEGSPQPGPSSTQPGQKQAGADGAATQTPGQGQPASPDQQPPAPTLSVEDRLALASVNALREQNQQLLERLRQVEQGGGQQPQGQVGQQGQAPQGQGRPGAGEEPLRLVMPDPLFDAINSEDPHAAKQGMSLLMTAVAQVAMTETLKRVTPLIDQRLSAVTSVIEGSKEKEKQENAYFERFPAHKNEHYRPLIQQAVEEKFRAFPHAKWDETMIDAVGATVNGKLLALGVDPNAQPQPQGQGNGNGNGQEQPRPRPAPMLDGSTRNANKVPQDAGDFIKNTFG